jgi:hypothetical protein
MQIFLTRLVSILLLAESLVISPSGVVGSFTSSDAGGGVLLSPPVLSDGGRFFAVVFSADFFGISNFYEDLSKLPQ